jgi:hypothetical protein
MPRFTPGPPASRHNISLGIRLSRDCAPRRCPPGSVPDNEAVLIQNLGTTVLYIGSSMVTAGTTAMGGLQVAANALVSVPVTGAASESIYGISTAACNVAYLFPG